MNFYFLIKFLWFQKIVADVLATEQLSCSSKGLNALLKNMSWTNAYTVTHTYTELVFNNFQ